MVNSSEIRVECRGKSKGWCKENNTVVVAETYLAAYRAGCVLLQDAFPMLSPEERDLIKFQLCEECLWSSVADGLFLKDSMSADYAMPEGGE